MSVRESRIDGLGLFAARYFEAGEIIRRVNVVRDVTPESPLREDQGELLIHCAYPRGKVILIGWPDRHVNHSCEPNAYEWESDGGRHYRALTDIQSGQEITINYSVNTSNGTTWGPCACGAADCLQKVHGEYFDLPVARQVEYLPLLSDWFAAAHLSKIQALRRATSA